MKKGDLVFPSAENNLVVIHDWEKLPLTVHNVKGNQIWVIRATKSGRIFHERWHIKFWTTDPEKQFKEEGAHGQ